MKKLLAVLLLLPALIFGQAAGVGQIWSVVSGTLQNGATATGNGTVLTVTGLSAVALTVNCSVACSGGTTINFEGSEDASNFSAINGQQMGTCTIGSTVVNQGTTPTVWEVNAAGLQQIRARISGYSAGTITVTGHATAAPFNPKCDQANLFVAGTTATTGTGAGGAGIPRVTVSNDSSLAANQSVNINQIGGQTTVTEGNGLQGVAPVATATTTNAASTSALQSAASTNSTSVKGSAGNVYGISAINTNTTIYYLRIYNSSSAPTCSSATGFIETIPVPPAAASGGAGGFTRNWAVPQGYSTGIGFCLTGGGTSTDNTNAATGVYVTFLYD